jgi:hypothetical protein
MNRYDRMLGLAERHPYIIAKERFVRGEWTREQAAAHAATDLELIAECELKGVEPFNVALRMTLNSWASEAVAYRQQQKREASHVQGL